MPCATEQTGFIFLFNFHCDYITKNYIQYYKNNNNSNNHINKYLSTQRSGED